MTVTPTKKGLQLLCLYLAVLGLVPGVFLLWKCLPVGLIFLLVWILLSLLYVRLHLGNQHLEQQGQGLHLTGGVLLSYSVWLPLGSQITCHRLTTPLMRRAGVCVLALRGPSLGIWLMGISRQDADALSALVGGTP